MKPDAVCVVGWMIYVLLLTVGPVHTQDSTVCGGELNQQSGVITSPGYPANYANNKQCYWTIRAAKNEIIDLGFKKLDLEGTETNNQQVRNTCPDYVIVYDGDSVRSPLIIALCRIKTLSELSKIIIRSSSNVLHVVFYSDYQGQRPGFVASYWAHECPEFTYGSEVCNNTCNCNRDKTASCNNTNGECSCKTGWTSPDCSQDLDECLNPRVEPCPFDYKDCVNTEGSFDCVCKAGLTENAFGECEAEPGAVCTTGNSCSHQCVNIATQGQPAQVHCYCPDNMKLVGNSCQACSNVAFGKDCRLSCPCPQNNTQSCDTETGGCICLKGWTLANCSKDIDECTELLGSACPSPAEHCVNTNGSYQCKGCSYTLTNSSGVIQSPNYPNNAYDNVNCSWSIIASDSRATVSFSMSSSKMAYGTSPGSPCLYNALEAYDGNNSSGTLIAQFCGYYYNEVTIRSTGNSMYLLLKTRTFNPKYFTGVFSTGDYRMFTSNLTASSGNIASPGYPAAYPHNVFSSWTIYVASEMIVTFSFSDYGLRDCQMGYIEFYDGTHAGANSRGRYCGAHSNLPSNVSSSQNYMHIIYSSQGNTSGKGFNGTYFANACKCYSYGTASCNIPTGPCVCKRGFIGSSCNSDIDECLTSPCPAHSTCINNFGSFSCVCWNGTKVNSNSSCDDWIKVLSDPSGYIQSQDFPGYYPPNVNYTWKIVGKEKTVVSFRIEHFDVDTLGSCRNQDAVEIYDGSRDQLMGEYCGISAPGLLRSTGEVMLVVFRTDPYNYYRSYTGFNGTFLSHACPLFTYGEETCTSPCSCAYDRTRVCDNTNGVCFCKSGWVGRGCSQDLNECRNATACPTNSDCINQPGTFSCQCHSGYIMDYKSGQCKERSQCSASAKLRCSHLCDVDAVTKKEFCVCPAGFELLSDKATCVVSLYPYGTEAADSVAYGRGVTLPVKPILFSTHVLFGTRMQAYASVHYNGVIMFNGGNIIGTPDLIEAQAQLQSVIAPFWTEKKNSGEGEVFYHVYDKCDSSVFSEPSFENTTSPKENEVWTRAVRDITNFYKLPGFVASTVLVATWNKVQPKGCKGNFTNTFQAIIVSGQPPSTDQTYLEVPETSYAIFIYKDGDGICQSGQPFEVGIVSDTGVKPLKINRKAPKLTQIMGNTGFKGVSTFKVGEAGQLRASVKCQRYLCKHADLITNQHFQAEIQELYQCPCSLDRLGLQWQLFKEDASTKCYVISSIAKRRLLSSNQRNRLCCYSWTPPKSDSWEDWHESWLAGSFIPTGQLLISDPWPWSQLFGISNTYRDAEENIKARTWCCEQSDYKFCSRFYKTFGDLKCTPHPTFVPASALGDPTIETFDGLSYLMNGWGIYVLIDVQSADFTLQARTSRVEINGTLSNGTVFTAFAAKDGEGAKIEIELATTNTSMNILANGNDFTNKFYKDVNFNWSYESMSVIRINENKRIIAAVTFACGLSFKVHIGVQSLEIDVEVDSSLRNKTRGLLGNFNGDPNDDFLLPNGTTLSPNITERQVLKEFAAKYLVTDTTSAFTFDQGETIEDYQHVEFEPVISSDIDISLLPNMKQICGHDRGCIYDYIVTGKNEKFATNTKKGKEIIDQTSQRLKNNPPTISFVTDTDSNNYWFVYEGKNNVASVKAKDADNDEVVCELLVNITGVRISSNGTITYSPDLRKPVRVQIRARDSKGAYSAILTVIVVVCPLCNNHGKCNVNETAAEFLDGQYQILKCTCFPAYTGDNCESEEDACQLFPCSVGQNCTDLTAAEQGNSSVGHRCGLCPSGTTNVNGSCEGINECSNKTACDQECLDTYRSFLCSCRPGFRLDASNSRTCNDINECVEKISTCEQECRNTIGSYTCACRSGYTLSSDGSKCIIAANNSAICQHCNQVCIVSGGQVTCDCNLGYKIDASNPNSCTDIDECNTGGNNPCSQICTNTLGKFQCSCYPGFKLGIDGVSCTVCDSQYFGNNCSSVCDCRGQGTCDRVLGCVCDKHSTGPNCDVDVNECENAHACPDGQVCVNEPGSFSCVCNEGYYMENGVCFDIDECLEKTSRCDLSVEVCINNLGNYSCTCQEGFKYNDDTGICEDINECELHRDGCQHICENGPGSYRCACFQGYRLANNRQSCVLVKNLCNLQCSHGCSINGSGTSFCIWPRGYRQVGTNSYEDINECASPDENLCDHKDRCVNTEGDYNCSCDPGYRLENDGRSCVACSSGTWGVECNNSCACGTESISCDPVEGCQCKPGCTGERCTEVINRCTSGELTCQPNEECVISGCNSVCQCRNGYVWNNGQCQDENECQDKGNHKCDQICTNTDGSYVCSCHLGYYYNSSTTSCQDNNECQEPERNNCHQDCINTEGSFLCTCFQGYRFNSSSNTCYVENACLNPDSNNCDQVCNNTEDGFVCSCYTGYHYNSSTSRCQACQNDCPISCEECVANNTISCDKTASQCNCKIGWTSKNCSVDVNECLQKPCPSNRTCKNLNGSYECVCQNGLHVGSNNTCKDCNRTLTGNTGQLMSSNYPDLYENNSHCTWTIKLHELAAVITFTFHVYDMEICPYDKVTIYDGANSRAPVLSTICDNWQIPVVSSGNSMTIVFTTDSDVAQTGFLASYTSRLACKNKKCSHTCKVVSSNPWTEECQCPDWMKLDKSNNSKCVEINPCNTTITKPVGYIVSPNYPDQYPMNLNCYWIIRGGPNSTVEFSISDLTIESSYECGYDSLSVYDGKSATARLLGHYCDSSVPPGVISSGNILYIVFKTDNTLSYKGFKGKYVIRAQ